MPEQPAPTNGFTMIGDAGAVCADGVCAVPTAADDGDTAAIAGAPSPVPSLPNLRDLGGWRAGDATVRSGVVYRCTDFSSLADADVEVLTGLGIGTLYDLRSPAEQAAQPDPDLGGLTHVSLDVLADAKMAVPANIGAFLQNPELVAKANDELAGGRVRDAIIESYRQLVTVPSARASYRTLFLGLLDDPSRPALFHCATGKDRTGWAAAAFLTLLGVDVADVYRDYLLSNERLLPALAHVFDGFAAAGGNPELLVPVLGVQTDYLDAAFAEVAQTYGTIEGYFADALGIDAPTQERLRRAYLV